jgi:hypothetical protein
MTSKTTTTSSNEKAEWTQTILTAAATGILAFYVGRYQRQRADELSSHVPKVLLGSPWAKELMLAVKLAKKGRNK